jgi:hypothetical protein
MRKTLTTVALLLALSCTAFGGEIHIPPAPTPPANTTQAPTPNDEDTGAADTLTQIVLTVLVSILP